SEELQVGGGKTRQNFEGGSIELSPGVDPVVRPAVAAVNLSYTSNSVVRLNIGDSIMIRATVIATTGEQLPDRQLTWATSNGRIGAVSPGAGANAQTASLKAVGGGTATISAVSDAVTSSQVTIFVAAPCCQIGEGAPTLAIQQSFQDAVTRHRL